LSFVLTSRVNLRTSCGRNGHNRPVMYVIAQNIAEALGSPRIGGLVTTRQLPRHFDDDSPVILLEARSSSYKEVSMHPKSNQDEATAAVWWMSSTAS